MTLFSENAGGNFEKSEWVPMKAGLETHAELVSVKGFARSTKNGVKPGTRFVFKNLKGELASTSVTNGFSTRGGMYKLLCTIAPNEIKKFEEDLIARLKGLKEGSEAYNNLIENARHAFITSLEDLKGRWFQLMMVQNGEWVNIQVAMPTTPPPQAEIDKARQASEGPVVADDVPFGAIDYDSIAPDENADGHGEIF